MRPIADIHKFRVADTALVLDVPSGSLHVVDEVAWEVLGFYHLGREECCRWLGPRHGAEQVAAAWEEVRELEAAGALFSREDRTPPRERQPLKALCLNVAHACDLTCCYCFAGQGSFGQPGLMSADTARAAVDFLVAASGSRPHCELDFFGGEPLLNLEVVRQTVDYARRSGKEFRFTLTTNATRLDREVAAYLDAEGFSVVLSLDGRPEVNDAFRTFPDGSGSYRRVATNIDAFVSGRGGRDYFVRGTYTRYNTDFSRDFLHLLERGWRRLSLEPVVAPPEADYALRPEDVTRCEKEYERLATLYLAAKRQCPDLVFFHFEVDLERGPCRWRALTGCGAASEYLAVTPAGELYPCHQFVGLEAFRLGDVWRGVSSSLVETFRRATALDKPACAACWARYLCGGGCHAQAYFSSGDLYTPSPLACRLQRRRLECALYVQASLRLAGLDRSAPFTSSGS
ncbi:MAG: thioether cross-link-forming SCIFF peptide maturase [Bacillota bacterium]